MSSSTMRETPQRATKKIACPYCHNPFDVQVEVSLGSRRKIVLCDTEDYPGCDRYFVLEYAYSFRYETKEIAGERDESPPREGMIP